MTDAVASVLVSKACKCFCSDELGASKGESRAEFEVTSELPHPIPAASAADLLAYSEDLAQPLRGSPVREGDLWFLRSEATADMVRVSLYVNGISVAQNGQVVKACMSPFILVRNCKFQDSSASGQLSSLKIFKMFFFTRSLCYFFGVQSDDEAEAEQERQSWVLDIARCVQLVTQSLFPPFRISSAPLQSSGVTARRLMAGYVLHHSDDDISTVLYAELSPHSQDGGMARLAFYENEQCTKIALEIWLSMGSNCFEKVGVNCTCFCINGHDFSARTISERKLWLRAISNMKVKLSNNAPVPTREDITHYRVAVEEQVRALEWGLEGRVSVDALLQRVTANSASEPGWPAALSPNSPKYAEYSPRSGSQLPSERGRGDDIVPPTQEIQSLGHNAGSGPPDITDESLRDTAGSSPRGVTDIKAVTDPRQCEQDSRPSSAAWTASRLVPAELADEPTQPPPI